jgi:hypothetical protein
MGEKLAKQRISVWYGGREVSLPAAQGFHCVPAFSSRIADVVVDPGK